MELFERVGGLFAAKDDGVRAGLDGDTLMIDCNGCSHQPDLCSAVCIRCAVARISALGNADRIRLRAGRDLEVSGAAAEVLCDLASLDRLVRDARGRTGIRCGGCEYAGRRIIGEAWEGFPEPCFAGARERLMRFRAEDRRCAGCIQRTYRLLDQAERGLENIRRRTLSAGSGGGF